MAEIQQVVCNNEDTIRYILNLIRYDIPILMSGRSSIGKSYTILKLAENWGMYNAVLYVGSEKADNIEGLPKLVDEQAEEKENVLTYFKPYWYPQERIIQESVQRGYDFFVKNIQPNFADSKSNNLRYQDVMGMLWALRKIEFPENSNVVESDIVDRSNYILKTDNIIVKTKITFTREPVTLDDKGLGKRNDIYDLCLFLCTVVGFGNYWLILDELDKVQEEEADKFAPMLHIVRERRLKTYNMRQFNDGKGSDVAMNIVGDSYVPIFNMVKSSLENNKSVLDTRIIAISNQTENIEEISDALFKRFVQIVITNVLVLDPVDSQLSSIRECLSGIEKNMKLSADLKLGTLKEVNLQWQFGFLPRILNKRDTNGNEIKKQYLELTTQFDSIPDEKKRKDEIWRVNGSKTNSGSLLWKLIYENYYAKPMVKQTDGKEVTLPRAIFNCLSEQLSPTTEVEEKRNPMDVIKEFQAKFDDKDTADEIYDLLMKKYELLPKDNRYLEMEGLIAYAFDFIKYTSYPDFKEEYISQSIPYSPLSINEYLIPTIIKFVLKIVTKDAQISFDDKDRLLSFFAQLWSDFTIPEHIDKLKGNKEKTQELFYGGADSLWGSSDLNADDFQNSFVNSFNSANIELFEDFLSEYMEMEDVKRAEFKDFIDYIKKYRMEDIEKYAKRKVEGAKKSAGKGKTPPLSLLVSKFKTLFDIDTSKL